MADNLRFPHSNMMILDSNGNPVSGAKLEVFDAGTSNQKTVYSDNALTSAAANPIIANNSGVVPVRYIGTGDYKVTFKDTNDAVLSHYNAEDNSTAALDTSSFLTGTVSPARSVLAKATTFTTLESEKGKQFNCDATGGDFTASLLSAVTLADGGDYGWKNTGDSGLVTVSATGGQTIDGKTSKILQPGDSFVTRSDGGNYSLSEAYEYTTGIVSIAFATSITPDFSFPTGSAYNVGTLTDNITVNNPTNTRIGQEFTLTLIQDATGGRTVTFGANFKGNIEIDDDASAVNVIAGKVRTATDIDIWLENDNALNRELLETVAVTSGTTATSGTINQSFNDLEIDFEGITSDAVYQLRFLMSDDDGSTFLTMSGFAHGSDGGAQTYNATTASATGISLHVANDNATGLSSGRIRIPNYAVASTVKFFEGFVVNAGGAISPNGRVYGATDVAEGAIDKIQFAASAGSFDGAGGEIRIYGIKP